MEEIINQKIVLTFDSEQKLNIEITGMVPHFAAFILQQALVKIGQNLESNIVHPKIQQRRM